MPLVELTVDFQRHAGWKTLEVTRSMEQLAASFRLSCLDRWAARGKSLPINEGAECMLAIDNETAVTGYVDDVEQSYDSESRTMRVAGRSRTGDLVDCSAIYKSGEWLKRTLTQIAEDLCEPFGISVEAEVGVERFKEFAIQEGEAVFECLERGARMCGVLLTSNASGALIITRASTKRLRTKLQRGVNVLKARRRSSWRDRYSDYRVKAQTAGSDDRSGAKAAGLQKVITDDAVTRYRPLTILAEAQGTVAALEKRAAWERAVRAGRSERLLYTVQGVAHDDGLWAPNVRVPVEDDVLRIDADLLIASATMRIDDEEGIRTELELTRPEAFDVLVVPPSKAGGRW